MLTPAHIRAARALLDITQTELAARAGISKTGLVNIERGLSIAKPATLEALERVLAAAGIEFLPGDDPGVRLRRDALALG